MAWTAICADAQGSQDLDALLRSEPGPTHVSPILALLRLMISSAFKDAKECSGGEPTETAMDAVAWLMKDAPSRYVTPPGSFAWCCSWLGFDPQTIREHGLPAVGSHYLCGADRTSGLSAIFEQWAFHMVKNPSHFVPGLRRCKRGHPCKGKCRTCTRLRMDARNRRRRRRKAQKVAGDILAYPMAQQRLGTVCDSAHNPIDGFSGTAG